MLFERLCPRDGLYAFASLRGSYEKSDERNARCYLKVLLARVSDDDGDDDVDVAIDVHLVDDHNDDDSAAKDVIQSSTSLPRGNQVDGLPRVCSLVHTAKICARFNFQKSITLGSKIEFFVGI